MLHNYTKEVKESAYLNLVRPILAEYAAIVWDPHQKYPTKGSKMVNGRLPNDDYNKGIKLVYPRTMSL